MNYQLRRFKRDDIDDLCLMEGNIEVMNSTGPAKVFTRKESEERLSRILENESYLPSNGYWALADLTDDKVVGWFMLIAIEEDDPEIGFMINQSFWGKGLASFGINELCKKARIDKLRRVVARANKDNPGSIKALEKNGFKIRKEDEKLFFFELKL